MGRNISNLFSFSETKVKQRVLFGA